jgi:hypothetical protein
MVGLAIALLVVVVWLAWTGGVPVWARRQAAEPRS